MTPLHIGNLEVRLAKTDAEVEEVQKLVDHVFFIEEGIDPESVVQRKYDIEVLNPNSDILIAVDKLTGKIIATYRFMRRCHADKVGGFYTKDEFDLTKILNYDGEIMEFSRAVTHKDYRDGTAIMAMWRGIGAYLNLHNIKLMFGVPSLHGTDVSMFKDELSYLYHFHLAREEILCRSKEYTNMNLVPKDQIDEKEAFSKLPPLFKGYLRLNTVIGDGAFVDHDFDTTDVQIIVETEKVDPRYLKHFLGWDV
ncbi:MAG: GNAT family N-acetyltransferase [Alphaproteobacteria bacterium]|nr:GNAT family N-acetyltransferase [Alphaproteobacteria bacterium]